MSGFTDAFYKAATARLGAKTIVTPPSYYVTGESPSVWFEADEVWEIRGAELTASPVHMAGGGRGGTGGRGLALRFPRFLSIREDKNVEDATNPDHVLSLFHKQSNRSAPTPQASATGPVCRIRMAPQEREKQTDRERERKTERELAWAACRVAERSPS
jgi:DNA ligase-1